MGNAHFSLRANKTRIAEQNEYTHIPARTREDMCQISLENRIRQNAFVIEGRAQMRCQTRLHLPVKLATQKRAWLCPAEARHIGRQKRATTAMTIDRHLALDGKAQQPNRWARLQVSGKDRPEILRQKAQWREIRNGAWVNTVHGLHRNQRVIDLRRLAGPHDVELLEHAVRDQAEIM